jgi:nucleoside-diphosphate-sugar epimerase
LQRQISIIGCGWLGLPLAESLIQRNIKIKGSTTTESKVKILKEVGIDPFLIRLGEGELIGDCSEFLSGSDTLIINIPPGLRSHPKKSHVEEVKPLIDAIKLSGIQYVIYISSISVYKNDSNFTKITEDCSPNATSNAAVQLRAIENLLQNSNRFKTTIIRLGGLFDQDRHPARYLSGKTNVLNPDAPINLIHKNDCIHIIEATLKADLWDITLNAVYPHHPKKREYYEMYCKKHQLVPPTFNSIKKSEGKTIDSSKLVQLLNYKFEESL